MALSPEQQAEYEELEREKQQIQASISAPAQPDISHLSPEAQAEFLALEDEKNQIHQQFTAPPVPETPTAEAAIQGFGQGVTLGYLPQLQAAGEKVVEFFTPESDIDRQLREEGATIVDEPQTFEQRRDVFTRQGEALQEAAPIASTVGEVAGALTGGVTLGGLGAAGKTATLGQRALTAAKTGGIIGFLENPGDTEGVTDPLQIYDRLANSAKGLALGVGSQVGLEGLGKIAKTIKSLPNTLGKFSEIKALESSGAMIKDFKRLQGSKRAEEIGRRLLDEKLVQAGDDVQNIAKKVVALKEEVGAELGGIYDKLTDKLLDRKLLKSLSKRQLARMQDTALNMTGLAKKLERELVSDLRGTPGASAVISRVKKEMATLAENGDNISLRDLQKVRRGFDKLINFDKTVADLPLLQQQFVKVRRRLNKAIEKRIGFFDDVFGSKNVKKLKEMNSRFSDLAEVETIAAIRTARDKANQTFGLSEKIIGTGGFATGASFGGLPGAVILGATGTFASKALRKYGNAAAADVGHRIAKRLAKNPSSMGKIGQQLIEAARTSPKQYMSVIGALSADPEFKKEVRRLK